MFPSVSLPGLGIRKSIMRQYRLAGIIAYKQYFPVGAKVLQIESPYHTLGDKS
jgi:hypothetical protein